MHKCKMIIWKRTFELPLEYECYPGEEVLESQKEAFAMLEGNAEEVEKALEQVKKYVEETGEEQLKEAEIENIFRYVMPKSIFVPHMKNHRIAAILCDYKFDMEHGIAVVFENGHLKEVGPEEIAF